jgi:threonine/homoserine/homoserine lactone efflux protein
VITVGNVLGIIIGVVAIIIGLILLVIWWTMFVKALMALVPILLIIIGAGVLVYFISEIKSKLEMGKEATATSEEKKPE